METYKLDPERYGEVRKKVFNILPAILVFVAAVITVFFFINGGWGQEIAYIVTLIVLLVVAFGGYYLMFYGSDEKFKRNLDSYILMIDENTIACEQYSLKPITLQFNEIKKIIKNPDGSFIIRSGDKFGAIIIPNIVMDYEKLEEQLNHIQPVIVKGDVNIKKWSAMVTGVTVAMFFIYSEESGNEDILIIPATAFMVFYLWILYAVLRSKNLALKTKIIFVVAILMIFFGVLIPKLII